MTKNVVISIEEDEGYKKVDKLLIQKLLISNDYHVVDVIVADTKKFEKILVMDIEHTGILGRAIDMRMEHCRKNMFDIQLKPHIVGNYKKEHSMLERLKMRLDD